MRMPLKRRGTAATKHFAQLLTRLCQGQRATVLQLPAAARPEASEKQATPEVREPSLSS
jgi:hypothetical protein